MSGWGSDVFCSDLGEALVQHRLAVHHRLGRLGAEVAEAEHRGAVGDDGDDVALGGVVVGLRLVVANAQAGRGNAGRIGQREIALGGQRLGRLNLELAGPAAGRSEEHTSELQSLMRISYAVFCLKKKKLSMQ